jgi:type IV secretion system protein VirD4
MAYYQFLLNLIYTDLFGHLLGSVQPNARPVYLLLGEFGHLAIPNFNVFATTARKYSVGFWFFLQSLSQLDARYGRHDAETILDGLQTEIYLPGANLDTARRLEQRLGQIADPFGQGRRQPLLTAGQIIRMKDNRAPLLYPNKRPAMLKTRQYFKQAELRRAADKAAANMPMRKISTAQLPAI